MPPTPSTAPTVAPFAPPMPAAPRRTLMPPAAPLFAAPPPPPTAAPVAAAPAAPVAPAAPRTVGPPPRPAAPPPGPGPVARPGAPAPPAAGGRVVNPFLVQDPQVKARRLARALISDMISYHPAKRAQALKDGTLKAGFEEEIKKSYEEYVQQVGEEMAKSTTHFTDALNEILAGGQTIF